MKLEKHGKIWKGRYPYVAKLSEWNYVEKLFDKNKEYFLINTFSHETFRSFCCSTLYLMKAHSGEASNWWHEAFCQPFFLGTAPVQFLPPEERENKKTLVLENQAIVVRAQ